MLLITFGCAQAVLGAQAVPGAAKESVAPKPTASAATKEEIAERFNAIHSSPTIKEIVRLSEAGTDLAVIQAYVESSSPGYRPKAEEIIYLHEHRVPSAVITALIQRGAQPREQPEVNVAAQPAAETPAPATANPASPQPTVKYVAPVANASYGYSSPNVIYVPYSGYSIYNSCYPRSYYPYYSRPYFSSSWGYPYGYGGYGYHGGYGHYGGYAHYRHCW